MNWSMKQLTAVSIDGSVYEWSLRQFSLHFTGSLYMEGNWDNIGSMQHLHKWSWPL